ncbi:MAG: mechanosensitive ion channel [Ardenticatenaceae bacterium]|nr:mechanosensitive ion channel [Anaerolineales bacterium]MCB8940460.1 mechanosensitive ion channel [Ardenticatenaceae bacterium]MCB8973476.1 mechanosensitive ion channel [Ardenticatenaceae bacterium]
MNNDNLNNAASLIEILRLQGDIFLAMIARPYVQSQIAAILFIVFISWLLPEGMRRWRSRKDATDRISNIEIFIRQNRWLRALYRLLAPLMALILLNVTIVFFAQLSIPNGLLRELANLIWLWLIYRALLTLLEAAFGAEARPYQNRIVTPIFLFLAFLLILGTLPGSVAVFDATLQLGTLSTPISRLMAAFVAVYLFFVMAWVVERAMVRYLPGRLNSEQGFIESVATLMRYALMSLGIVVALGFLGLDFTSMAIIVGGLSVGIGIGLQDIVANFVSGLVLLFEQSLRPGDIIELDGRISRVEKISLRATTVRTRTNTELIIPNSNFTSQQVENLTKTDTLVVVSVPLHVSYKSDPETIMQLAVETAAKHAQVLPNPPPSLSFIGYGESGLDFSLFVSITQPELSFSIRSDLYYMLWKTFKEHNVEIPFPQRDLNLGDGWENLTVRSQAREPKDE